MCRRLLRLHTPTMPLCYRSVPRVQVPTACTPCSRLWAEDTGFFLLGNHGVPHDLIDKAFDSAHAFFALSDEQKLQHVPSGAKYWGYGTPPKSRDSTLGRMHAGPYGSKQNCSPNSARPERRRRSRSFSRRLFPSQRCRIRRAHAHGAHARSENCHTR